MQEMKGVKLRKHVSIALLLLIYIAVLAYLSKFIV